MLPIIEPWIAVVAVVAFDVAGWIGLYPLRKRIWIKSNMLVMLPVILLKGGAYGLAACTVPGMTEIPVILGLALSSIFNPYYVLTGGVAIGNRGGYVRKHKQYRMILSTSVLLGATGCGTYYSAHESIPWVLTLLSFMLLYVVSVVPPRQLIKSQQFLYTYRPFGTTWPWP